MMLIENDRISIPNETGQAKVGMEEQTMIQEVATTITEREAEVATETVTEIEEAMDIVIVAEIDTERVTDILTEIAAGMSTE